ncbi:hypothetical protein TNCV_1503371 [Trichonephila clavipes]|uniref:Uncharacterized protein n=1 Tax=Trichonephila clavipes TaxID=2585209 RepID=A0A8X6RYG4_TRICX|nr:hypothetical protein TNCV_1503371 [Trichonephila clavipes]
MLIEGSDFDTLALRELLKAKGEINHSCLPTQNGIINLIGTKARVSIVEGIKKVQFLAIIKDTAYYLSMQKNRLTHHDVSRTIRPADLKFAIGPFLSWSRDPLQKRFCRSRQPGAIVRGQEALRIEFLFLNY